MNGVQTRFKCKLDVKRCKRFVFPPSSLLPRSNALKTKAIRYFQTDRTLTRIVSPPLIDPLAELDIDVQSFDIPRMVSVFPDKSGIRWWTKAWFNGSEKGEAAIEIERELAIKFINENIEKDEWLEEYFPKQMEVYHNAIEQTREQLLNQINL